MRNLFFIFIGGGIGSVARFLVSGFTQRLCQIGQFPAGTFVVNIVGCFFIGVLSAYFLKVDNYLKFLLITGFCGGFTTFSTFSAENFTLFQNGSFLTLGIYTFLSVVLALLAVFLGFQVIKN